MAQLITTLVTDITAPVNFVLMRELLVTAKLRLPYFFGSLPGKLEKKQGSASVKWRRIENLATATTALSEQIDTLAFGNGRDAVNPSITDVTVAIAKYGNAIITTEEVDLINVNSDTLALMGTLGDNAGRTLNEIMRDVYDSETTARYASGKTTRTALLSSISLNDIKNVVNVLNNQSAIKFSGSLEGSTRVDSKTVRESYIGICHVDVEEDIRALTGFIGVEQYGGYSKVHNTEIGAVGGVRWLATETAPVAIDAGTTTATSKKGTTNILNDVYSTFIFGKNSIGSIGLGEQHTKEIYMLGDRIPAVELIQHKPGSSGVADMFNEVGSIAWKSWWAAKVLNSNWVKKIETLATDT
jgi:N4-gp56 family major capsid protein